MLKDDTIKKIHSLPPIGKVAFAVRCVRIVWDNVVQAKWKDPPETLNEGLKAIEKWHEDIEDWNKVKNFFNTNPIPANSSEVGLANLRTQLNGILGTKILADRKLAQVIKNAFNAAISPYSGPEQISENKVWSKVYEDSREAAEHFSILHLFDEKATEGIEKLNDYIKKCQIENPSVPANIF